MAQKSSMPPRALFDDLEHIRQDEIHTVTGEYRKEFELAISFFKAYTGSRGTFNSYRREIEKLFQWAWHVAKKLLKDLKREDIESFIHFTQSPPKAWIGLKKAARFLTRAEGRVPNPEWRPFVTTLSKSEHKRGKTPTVHDFQLSVGSIKESFAILSSFYNYLIQEEYVSVSPVALIRQKSKFIRKIQSHSKIRRLSDLQWKYLIKTVEHMAMLEPEKHERSLFILSALYSMYLRISELASNPRWIPMMNHFHRDQDGHWWFTTVGKGNKERQIAVSDAMLEALKRWRCHLGLSPLPSAADTSPLLPKLKGKGPIESTTYIRELVQSCFDQAMENLRKDGLSEEADALMAATVHWLRHTGISDDVKHRPREHVRDDAGHASGATTDRYVDVELKARHRTARKKPMVGPHSPS